MDKESNVATAFDKLELNFFSEDKVSGLKRAVVFVEQVDSTSERLMQSCTGIFISRNHLLTPAHCSNEKLRINPWNTVAEQTKGDYALLSRQGVLFGEFKGRYHFRFEMQKKSSVFLSRPIYRVDRAGVAVFYVADQQLDAIYGSEKNRRFDWINLSRLKGFDSSKVVLWHFPWGMPFAESLCMDFEASPPNLFAHTCDALPGSSGGLIIDKMTQSPIAMHLSGPGQNLYSYYDTRKRHEYPMDFALKRGCKKAAEGKIDPICLRERGYNKAVPLMHIKDVLAQEDRWLWDQIAEAARKENNEP